MRTLADAIAQLRGAEAGGFDFSETQAALLLNEGVKRLAAQSEWVRAELELGPTIAGQEEYSLPDRVVKLRRVNVAGYPFERVDLETLWDLKLGRLTLARGGVEGGAFAERFTDDGKGKLFSLYGPPSEDGLSITGLASILPDDLEVADELPFPEEFRRAVLDYAKGIAYEEWDENPQTGSYYLGRAEGEAAKLLARTNSRTGAGPHKARVAGHAR